MRIVLLILFGAVLYAQKPDLLLLKTYKNDHNVTGWVMSEKLDGVRAYWDGKKLTSRNGKVFHAPSWFTQGFPDFSLDGELWSKRGDFEHIVSVVNTSSEHKGWESLGYYVFEVPEQKGGLLERLALLDAYMAQHNTPYLHRLEQYPIKNTLHMNDFYNEILRLKGEGIVIRDPRIAYVTGRSQSALKHKPFEDDECVVQELIEGNGKYMGKMGSLSCLYQGKLIKIGSGFSDTERANPPKVGSVITFKYYGLTGLGNPRFPVYLRERKDMMQQE